MVGSSEADSEQNLEEQDTKRKSMCEMFKIEKGTLDRESPQFQCMPPLPKKWKMKLQIMIPDCGTDFLCNK